MKLIPLTPYRTVLGLSAKIAICWCGLRLLPQLLWSLVPQSWKQLRRDLANNLMIHQYAQTCGPIPVAPEPELPNFCVDTAATQHLVPQTMSHWPFTNELNQACLDIGMSDGSTIRINGLKAFPGAGVVDAVIGQQEKHELYEVAAEYPLLPIRIS